jgi:hypothetical protein
MLLVTTGTCHSTEHLNIIINRGWNILNKMHVCYYTLISNSDPISFDADIVLTNPTDKLMPRKVQC